MTSLDLHVQGMTCASCAHRIEKKLNKLDGVTATVNYATEKAHVDADRPLSAGELVDVIRKAGYDAVDPGDVVDDAPAASPTKLIVAIALAVPVIALSMISALQFPGWQWFCLAASLVVVGWCGGRFHRAAWTNLRHGAATMDTLISLGTLSALGWSIYALVWGHAGMIGMTHTMGWSLDRHAGSEYIYLEAAVGIIMFLLLGRYLEERAKYSAGDSLRTLLRAGARTATVLRREDNGTITLVERPVEALSVGDRMLVKEGQKIPTDGIIREGRASVDNAVITGESVPVRREVGDVVIGGAVNTDGRLVVEAIAVGAQTQLARIASLVEAAQSEKAGAQRLADKISGVFVPIVVAIALLTLAGWLIAGAGPAAAVGAAVAVLIIACPCALGLATPVALLVGTGKAAELGIAISGPVALERSAKIDTVVLDKTGTLTSGIMRVVDVRTYGMPRAIVQRLAAAAEAGSSHPVAKAIALSVDPVPVATDFAADAGRGVSATVEGHRIRVGSPAFVTGEYASQAQADIDELVASGATVAVVSVDDVVRGVLALRDEPVTSAGQAVADLRALGLTPVLLTGDHEAAAATVAAGVGIDDVRASVSPEGKADVVRALQAEGKKVAMVGDGVNDAAALASADLGIAMGTGTDVAAKAADMTLVAGDIASAPVAIRLARATLRTIRTNLVWAFGYNVIAIPLAALGYLQPMIAGAAMAASSLFVVLNSLRLKGFRASK